MDKIAEVVQNDMFSWALINSHSLFKETHHQSQSDIFSELHNIVNELQEIAADYFQRTLDSGFDDHRKLTEQIEELVLRQGNSHMSPIW